MRKFLLVYYDGYVGVENLVLTAAQLLSEEQSHRPPAVREWAAAAAVGDFMEGPRNRKDVSEYTIVRVA